MAEAKTKKTKASVQDFLAAIKDPGRREDAQVLLRLMKKVTKETPKMWGSSIVGFGQYHYEYATGRSGDTLVTGFSPRSQNLTVYVMTGFAKLQSLLAKLGKHSTGKSCLYIKRLSDIDPAVLETIIAQGYAATRALDGTKQERTPTPRAEIKKMVRERAKKKSIN
jgi:hypothetical protein